MKVADISGFWSTGNAKLNAATRVVSGFLLAIPCAKTEWFGMQASKCFIIGFFFSLVPSCLTFGQTITQEELVRRAQELFDAVVPGNQEPWKKYYAEDCIYADEKGRNLNKKALVADITAMPDGYSGTIKVVRPQSRIVGDTAILSYDLDEPKPSSARISRRGTIRPIRG